MMSAIFGGDPDTAASTIGWVTYLIAIIQYLIIALITSADKAGDLLSTFDLAIAHQREGLVEEFVEKEEAADGEDLDHPSTKQKSRTPKEPG